MREAVRERELLEDLVRAVQLLVGAREIGVRALDLLLLALQLDLVAAQAVDHFAKRSRQHADLVLAGHLGDLDVGLALRNPARGIGQRADRPHDRARDRERDQRECQHDCQIDRKHFAHRAKRGREGDVVVLFDDQRPVEAAEAQRAAHDVRTIGRLVVRDDRRYRDRGNRAILGDPIRRTGAAREHGGTGSDHIQADAVVHIAFAELGLERGDVERRDERADPRPAIANRRREPYRHWPRSLRRRRDRA